MTEGIYVPPSMADVRRTSAQDKFVFASFFSGIGGSSIGYMLAGGRGLLAIDRSAEAVRTYKRNMPDTIVVQGDVREVAETPAAVRALFARAALDPGDLDVFDASPPCNPFSRLGPGVTAGGPADLISHSIRAARTMMPAVVVIESVAELATTHRDVLENALDGGRFGDRGERLYFAAYRVLPASHYGVPQRRRRTIAILVRADDAEEVGITDESGMAEAFPARTTPIEVTVRSALEGLQQSAEDVEPWDRAMMTSALVRIAPLLVRDPEKWIRPRWIKPRDVGFGASSRYTLIRLDPDLPSCTLTASGQQPDGRCGVLHPAENRKLTIPELKRLSSLPDDFVLTGTLDQQAECIGMMVPPLLMKAIAERVYERVLWPYAERHR